MQVCIGILREMEEIPFAMRECIGCTVDYVAGRNRYMGYLMSLGAYSFKGLRIGLDTANGSSWFLAKGLFDALGAKTYVIHNAPDGTNINNGCGSTHIEGLQELVKREHLDAGFAFDGAGIEYEKTAVGDKYVYECMSEQGFRIGGEQSGHIIFSKYATTGDGLITAMKMLEVMVAKKTLSQLAAPFVMYPQVLKNIRVTDKTEAQNDAEVKAAVAKVAEELGSDGRILVRESGTEPVVRVMVEAGDHETCERYVDEVIAVIQGRGFAV